MLRAAGGSWRRECVEQPKGSVPRRARELVYMPAAGVFSSQGEVGAYEQRSARARPRRELCNTAKIRCTSRHRPGRELTREPHEVAGCLADPHGHVDGVCSAWLSAISSPRPAIDAPSSREARVNASSFDTDNVEALARMRWA